MLDQNEPHLYITHWSFDVIRKTNGDQKPKPQTETKPKYQDVASQCTPSSPGSGWYVTSKLHCTKVGDEPVSRVRATFDLGNCYVFIWKSILIINTLCQGPIHPCWGLIQPLLRTGTLSEGLVLYRHSSIMNTASLCIRLIR